MQYISEEVKRILADRLKIGDSKRPNVRVEVDKYIYAPDMYSEIDIIRYLQNGTTPILKAGQQSDNLTAAAVMISPIINTVFSDLSISSEFGMRKLSTETEERMHNGIDIANVNYIVAVADGEVTFAGENGTAGYNVDILHANNVKTRYMHLKAGSICVAVGEYVRQGQKIGYVGNTGHSYGDHLHFEVRTGASKTTKGTANNPRLYLEGNNKIVEVAEKEVAGTFTVNTNNARLRAGATTGSYLITTLPNGTTGTVISKAGEWYNVDVGGQTGYIYYKYIDVEGEGGTPVTEARYGMVTGTGVNVRDSASLMGNILQVVNKGMTLEFISQSGDWYYVKLPSGVCGYIHSEYLSVTNSPITSEVIAKEVFSDNFESAPLFSAPSTYKYTQNIAEAWKVSNNGSSNILKCQGVNLGTASIQFNVKVINSGMLEFKFTTRLTDGNVFKIYVDGDVVDVIDDNNETYNFMKTNIALKEGTHLIKLERVIGVANPYNMTASDFLAYANNKRIIEDPATTPEAFDIAAAENSALREKYGVADLYTYAELFPYLQTLLDSKDEVVIDNIKVSQFLYKTSSEKNVVDTTNKIVSTPDKITITADGADVLSSPISGTVLSTADRGETFEVVGEAEGWYEVKNSDGTTGYVKNITCDKTTGEQRETILVKTGGFIFDKTLVLDNVISVDIDNKYELRAAEASVTIENIGGYYSPDYNPVDFQDRGLNVSPFTENINGEVVGVLSENAQVRIYIGYGQTLQRRFTGLIDTVDMDAEAKTLTFKCTDMMKKLNNYYTYMDLRYPPYDTQQDVAWLTSSVISDLAKTAGMTSWRMASDDLNYPDIVVEETYYTDLRPADGEYIKYNEDGSLTKEYLASVPDEKGYRNPHGLTGRIIPRGTCIADVIDDLCQNINYWQRCDFYGTYRATPVVYGKYPVATFRDTNNIVSLSKSIDGTRIRNHLIVQGGNTEEHFFDDELWKETKGERRTAAISVPWADDYGKKEAVARKLFADMKRLTRTLQVCIEGFPYLEIFDRVVVESYDTATKGEYIVKGMRDSFSDSEGYLTFLDLCWEEKEKPGSSYRL